MLCLHAHESVWKELCHVRLIRTSLKTRHGSTYDELSDHFVKIYISSLGTPQESLNIVTTTDGFTLQPASKSDVVLAVSHFKSQSRGDYG